MRVLLAALALPLLAGCVERLIAVRSEPGGADVYVDGERIGQTPLDIPYIWYGTREIVLEKRGFREIRERVALNPPWWQYPGFDLITDVVLPFTITDRVEFSFHMERAPVSREEIDGVLRRADETRALSEPK
ncbi:MAG TPA: PEGA domain-containing protein [Planctomycetota bacterium]